VLAGMGNCQKGGIFVATFFMHAAASRDRMS
jgi:hypothetical protein